MSDSSGCKDLVCGRLLLALAVDPVGGSDTTDQSAETRQSHLQKDGDSGAEGCLEDVEHSAEDSVRSAKQIPWSTSGPYQLRVDQALHL